MTPCILVTCGSFNYDISNSYSVASNDRIREQRNGKDLEIRGLGLIGGHCMPQYLPGETEARSENV
jgi:hypothetical protein